MLIAIWAQDRNGLIGNHGKLPWHLPNDLKFFKEKTSHHTIVMGRKTFEGMNCRPLPNRTNIVLTHDLGYHAEGVMVMHDKQELLLYAEEVDHPVFITGGAGVFAEMIEDCDQLYRTVIEAAFTGDVYFPTIDWAKWQLIETIIGTTDEKNRYPHRFEFFDRIKVE